ncbi:MAG: 2-dehydropantoate 2-reductase [Verrucomicrobia bacterium]|nr:2-dehydropantoate 2-reductase [Verrucomicrobiota bacterium]
MASPKLAVFGAGSIGCYVGGRLGAAGGRVTLIGRPRLAAEVRAHGLHLTDWRGADLRVPPEKCDFATEAEAARAAEFVLVTVKSAATAEAGHALAAVLRPEAVVISLQNGLGHAERLRAALPGRTVLAGLVGFNVIQRGGGAFHQGSEGRLEVQAHPALGAVTDLFAAAGLPLLAHADLTSVQWAKLQLNLNNAINALSGRPLLEELSQRAYRRCLAAAQRELLRALAAAGIRPARLTPLPPGWIPTLLELPDGLFRIVARRLLAIDPLARSSMWEDFEARRRTEVDWLNGEVVRLAAAHGLTAPVNARLVEFVRAAEAGGRRDWTGSDLCRALLSDPAGA